MEDNLTENLSENKNSSGTQKTGKVNTDDSNCKRSSKTMFDKVPESDSDPREPQDIQHIDAETQSRLKAFLEVAGVKLSHVDARTFQDPEILRKLTNSVSNALDEAATALNRMRSKQGNNGGGEEHQKAAQLEDNSLRSKVESKVEKAPVAAAVRQNKQPTKQQQPQQQHDVADIQALQHLLGQAGHGIHETAEDGESLLSLACSAGYFELAEVLLRMRASVEDRGIKGDSTPLMEAASGGYADIVKLLIDHGANVNATSSVGNTALTYACCGGFEDVVRILLDNGAEVEHQNENGHTPLMEAASCGHVGVAKLLLEYGANINTHSNEFKESALTLACYKGHLDMVKFLLGAGADQDHKTDEMHTALMEACMDGHVEVARLLLDHGAQVNMPVDSFESPLTLAACGGHFELAALLLSRGADLEEVNDEGYTPLMEAAREGHEDVVQLLVDHGASINAQTEETQETALTLACCGGFLEVAQYLVDHGADIELGASTPLMEASQEGHIEIVKYLISKGANIHAVTNTADTCLTYACANGHTNIAKLLLECGAVLEHESEGGRTPLMKSARAGHMETVQFLISQGADSNRITVNNDHSVLSLACAGGHIGIVKYLLMQGADSAHILKDNSTMLIEAARGGHSSVVGLLLQQPKFTAALKNQIAQRQSLASSTAEHVTSIAGKRRTRGSQPGSGGRGKKQQKTPVLKKEEGGSGVGNGGVTRGGGGGGGKQNMLNGQQPFPFQSQISSGQPVLRHHVSSEPGPSPSKIAPNSNVDDSLCQPLSSRHPQDRFHEKVSNSVKWTSEDKQFEPSEFTVNPSYKFGQAPSLTPDGDLVTAGIPIPSQISFPVTSTPSSSSSGGSYLLPPIFAQSSAYSNQEHMEAYMKADEILRNHMMQLDYAKQQALMNALESLMLQSEAHRASIGIGGDDGDGGGRSSGKATTPPGDPPIITTSTTTSKPSSPNKPVESGGEVEEDSVGKSEPISEVPGSDKESAPPTKVLSQETTQPSGAPPWSFTDPSRMPQFSMGVSTLAPSTNSPEKQSPKSSHHQSPGKHLSFVEKQAFASRIASRLEQVNSSPSGRKEPLPTPSGIGAEYYSGTPVTQFFNSIDGTQSSGLYNNSPSKFSFSPSLEQRDDHISNTQVLNTSFSPPQRREPSPFTGTSQPCSQLNTTNSCDTSSTSSVAPELSQLPPVPLSHHTQYLQPIYSPDLATLKHLTHRMPPPGAEMTATQQFDAHGRPLPMASSIWLDANFPLDIPPPSDLIPDHLHHMIPGGYSGHLVESESSSMEGELDDEEEDLEEDLALHPDLSALPAGSYEPAIDIDQQTDSNHDTALTLASAGGHDDLVELLLERGADIEHRDKKGCTPIILAANAGHAMTVAILLEHNADMESQTERTKDTALSLACSSGRQEVVELLLAKGANFEHRNVSDYTPLSLAASGGYVTIIKMLLKAGADINSRTGSKLGISPLMLAAMNGHTTTVKLLLDFGSDINAQIETNRNTALTLACFQGRHEVVNLLVERQANVEHRAKTGLTPLMEAASGGYHEVGMVLINKGADVNAAPVPSSRDTALTIAADKGHYKFVELLLRCSACVDVKNKKGNSPLWLAANGGHLDVTRLLVENKADVDSQDNRKVSCLMAAFRKGHYKVVKYLVEHVTQFPSDADLNRYINTLSDKELIKKCQRCMEVIIHAKERQAAEANKNASILLQELEQERQHEENRKATAARKRARKRKQKEKKKAQEKGGKNGSSACVKDGEEDTSMDNNNNNTSDKENIDKQQESPQEESGSGGEGGGAEREKGRDSPNVTTANGEKGTLETISVVAVDVTHIKSSSSVDPVSKGIPVTTTTALTTSSSITMVTTTTASSRSVGQPVAASLLSSTPSSSPRRGKKDEGWKEVGKRAKKLSIPASKFGQVVGRSSNNLTLIRSHTGASIEVEKSSRQAPTRTLIIKGSYESIRQAQHCIDRLQRDPNCDLLQLLQIKVPLSSSQSNRAQSSDSFTAHNLDNAESSWKVAGRLTSSSTKPRASHSSSDVTNLASIPKQSSGPLKTSRSAAAIERKSSFSNSSGTERNIRSSNSVTSVPVSAFSTASWIPTMHSPAGNTPKSGAVRQLFTSSASSHQTTSTSSVNGVKMSTTSSLQKSLQSSSNSSSWKPIGMTMPIGSNNKIPSACVAEDRNQRPSGGNRIVAVTGKATTQSSNPVSNNGSGSGGDGAQNVFEQILKTPSLFPEVASQIAQPKKCMYSAVVGKKPSYLQPDGQVHVSSKAVYTTSNPVTTISSGAGIITTSSNPGTHLINRAPGTKPAGLEQPVKHTVPTPPVPVTSHEVQSQQQRRTSPWNEDSSKEEVDFNISGENISPGSSLGPIAPPSRSSKPSTISPKNLAGPSPQRPLQTPPVAKSPLLGHAPSGLLPLPDKNFSPSAVFRPIHPEGTDLPNIVPTQMPTPVRNSRPPLLATPSVFPSTQLIQGGIAKARSETGKRSPLSKRIHHANPGSPFQGVIDVENRSPTKSPSLQQQQQPLPPPLAPQGATHAALNKPLTSSNFNPNAPSFVPMGMPQVPQTTSSILGNPPSNLKYSIPVPISSSILGTAPQLPASIGGPTSQGTMTPPAVMNSAGHPPPPPPPPPPPTMPALINGQPSLLGNPPFHLLVSQTVPSVPPNVPPPNRHQMIFGNQYDSTAPPTLPPLIQNLPNQFSPHPNVGVAPPRDVSEQFLGPTDSSQVFGFPSNIPSLLPVGGASDPNALPPWNNHNQFGGQNMTSGLGDLSFVGDSVEPEPSFPPSMVVDRSLSSTGPFTPVGPPTSMTNVSRGVVKDEPGLTHSIGEMADPKSGSGISAFSVLPPGISTKSSLWTFTPPSLGVSEDSGWTKPGDVISTSLLDYMSSDWPVMTSSASTSGVNNPTGVDLSGGGDVTISPQDDLQTVLERLGLGQYHQRLQKNEIDLHALMLMSEKDFTEVGIPKGPRIMLLNALGRPVGDYTDQSSEKEDNQECTLLSTSNTGSLSNITLSSQHS